VRPLRHAAGDDAGGQRRIRLEGLTQNRQFTAQLIEHVDESLCRGAVRCLNLASVAECHHDQIDRPVVR